jgi:16S rRNA (uracil1498-N3)-methyltransferase
MGPRPAGGPEGPDPVLSAAAAMVFVDDPATPMVTESDAHHLLDVLRLRHGELVVAADGAGSWTPCRMAARPPGRGASDPGSTLVVDGPLQHRPRPEVAVTVAFAPAKGDRPEWVVQKLTELGVDRIVPIRTARSVVRWDGERGPRAVERLRRVAKEASAQSRRLWLPDVDGVATVAELVVGEAPPPCLAQPGGGPPSLAHPVVAVGPEGGWDDDELAGLEGRVGLGPTVLRAETAAVVVGSLLCGIRSGVVGTLA